MRTTLTVDDFQAADLMALTGKKSAVAAIRQALDDYLRQARKQKVLALRGQVALDDTWRSLREADIARQSKQAGLVIPGHKAQAKTQAKTQAKARAQAPAAV